MQYLWYLIKRNEYLMTERTHNELGIVNKLLKLTLFLLRVMSGGRIISVFDDVPIGFDSKIAELVLKIAYLGQTEGVVGGSEHHSFRPVVLIGIPLMLHKAIEYALAVLPDASLLCKRCSLRYHRKRQKGNTHRSISDLHGSYIILFRYEVSYTQHLSSWQVYI